MSDLVPLAVVVNEPATLLFANPTPLLCSINQHVCTHLLLATHAPQLESHRRLYELVDSFLVLVEADGTLVQELDHVAHGAVRNALHLDVPCRLGGGGYEAAAAADAVVVVLADRYLVARQSGRGGEGIVPGQRK